MAEMAHFMAGPVIHAEYLTMALYGQKFHLAMVIDMALSLPLASGGIAGLESIAHGGSAI
jgi:hypothetical protein